MRSEARISGRLRLKSALSTPTKVTLGKSSPLATIWVPMRIWVRPAAKLFKWLGVPLYGGSYPRIRLISAWETSFEDFLYLLCPYSKLLR